MRIILSEIDLWCQVDYFPGVCVAVVVCVHTCVMMYLGGQKSIWGSWFSLSTIWVRGLNLGHQFW